MKKIISAVLLSVILFGFTLLPSDCSTIFFFKEGSSATSTHYDSKDKITGSTKTVYKKVNKFGSGATASAEQENYDKKGKLTVKNDFTIKCENGILYFDMKMYMPQQQAEAYKDMEVTVDGNNVEYPSNLKIGQSLKDATIKFTIKTKEGAVIPMSDMTIKVTDRKVEAKETVTTPAGTFECFKITESSEIKTIFSAKAKSVIWFNEEYGNIKSETYSDKGKYAGRSELTSFTK